MTDNNHPINPPPELVQQWARYQGFESPEVLWRTIATQAARWGADEQLEMDATWVALQTSNQMSSKRLIAEMRPKPPNLKEQAQRILVENGITIDGRMELDPDDIGIIRRALESLPD